MTPQDLLNVVKAFFDAVIKVFEALGLIKSEEAGTEETTEA